MRTIIAFIFILSTNFIFGQNIQFNDTIFKNRLIEEGVDLNNDGEISVNEAHVVSSLHLAQGWHDPITDLTGIEYFINIDSLDCYGNDLVYINISNNTQLQYFNAGENYSLDTLIFGFNTSLQKIKLDHVHTDNIFDFSGLPNLAFLQFSHPKALDLTNNTNLEFLRCFNAKGPIDISNNPNLIYVQITNQAVLNVSKSINLEYLYCPGNVVGNTFFLENIDLSNNILLKELNIKSNNISELDLSKNINLEYINCSRNPIKDLDFTNNIEATSIICSNDSLSSINISGLTYLESLWAGSYIVNNALTELDISTNVNLMVLSCKRTSLETLDLSSNIFLEELYCSFNQFDSLVFCTNHELDWVEVGGMPSLEKMYFFDTLNLPNINDNGSPNINILSCDLLGINMEQSTIQNFKVFPIPARKKIYIKPFEKTSNLDFKIFDIHGKMIQNGILNNNNTSIEHLKSGIYFFQLNLKDSIFRTKIIKL